MSIEETNDKYDNSGHVLSSFQREHSLIRDESQRISQRHEQNLNLSTIH